MGNDPKYILVHHSAAASPVPQFDAIEKWHAARRFPISSLGFHVGYHCVIEKDGTLVRAREDLERDCDALGHNFDSLSVCLVGNFNAYKPTPEQIATLGALLSEWCIKWDLTADDIFPHRRFGTTDCYGTKLTDNWAAYTYLRYEVDRLTQALEGFIN